MIKKLVRYGNSNALVIDRAILDLLGINEGGMVKMSTDGKSLIITPENSVSAVPTAQDAIDQISIGLASRFNKSFEASTQAVGNDINELQKAVALVENPELMKEMTKKYRALMKRYAADMAKIQAPEAMEAMEALQEKYEDKLSSPEYVKEMLALRYEIAPGLKQMDEEMKSIHVDIDQKLLAD